MSSFRWEPVSDGGSFAYSGTQIIGHVAPIHAATKWAWCINDVASSKYQRATSGRCESEAGAKRAFRRAWLHWIAERGLVEVER